MKLPAYIVVSEASPTGLVYTEKRGKRRAGDPCGSSSSDGYWRCHIDGRQYLSHRLVWEYHNGSIPAGMDVEHIDRDRSNCKLSNLRLATRSQNMQNTAAHKDSSTGFKGVSKERNSYHAYVNLNGKRYSAYTATLEAAVEWVRKKREELHDSEFVRHS